LDRGQSRRDPSECHGRRDDVIRVTAVVRNPRDQGRHETEAEIAAAALVALSAVPSVPADSDAVALLPGEDALADGVQDARDLVARHARVLNAGEEPLLRQHVAVADAVRLDSHPDHAGTGRRDLALDE